MSNTESAFSKALVILAGMGLLAAAVALCAWSGNVRLIADPEAGARAEVVRVSAYATATAAAIQSQAEATALYARVNAEATRQAAAAETIRLQAEEDAQLSAHRVALRAAVLDGLTWAGLGLIIVGALALAVVMGAIAYQTAGRARIAARWLPVYRRGNDDLPMLVGAAMRILPDTGEQAALTRERPVNPTLAETQRAAWLARIEAERARMEVLPPPGGE